MNSKVIVAALVGGVSYFLLGWLIFGILLADSMEEGMSENMKMISRGQDNYIIWGFAVGNLAYALLLAMALNKFGVKNFMKGATAGAWIGFLIVLSYDFGMYAQFNLFDLKMVFMDAIFAAIMSAIVGGIVGFMLGRGKAATT